MTQTTQGPRGPAEMSDAEELWYSGKWIDRVPQWVSITVLGLAMLGLWWLIAELMPTNLKILLAGPADTFEELWDTTKNIVSGGHIAEGLWITTQEVLLGFLAAAILGFVLGVVVGETRLGKRTVMPYLVAL
ncbi:MAG: ABC transporter permease, partial [Acidimicrobiia bacterium]|nr:ABC transporter permease [Acidimicrobiia bacterium]